MEMETINVAVCVIDITQVPADHLVLPLDHEGDQLLVATWLPAEMIKQIGIPPFGVCGTLRGKIPEISTDNFSPNSRFIDTLNYLSKEHVDPGLREFAANTTQTKIAIVDQRSPDANAGIPPEDVIGIYDVAEEFSFAPNPNYRLLTDQGMFKLTPWLRYCLVGLAEQYANTKTDTTNSDSTSGD